MDSRPKKPGGLRDKLGCQAKARKFWGTASLLLLEKHGVSGDGSRKDARFIPTPFFLLMWTWSRSIHMASHKNPLGMLIFLQCRARRRRDVLHKPLWPRCSSGADMSTEIRDLAGTLGSRLGTGASTGAEEGDPTLPLINSNKLTVL